MEKPVVPNLLIKIYRESGMTPLRCSGDHRRPCRGRLRIGRGKSRAPVLPRVAGRLLPAPASVVAGPVFVTCCRPASCSHFCRSLHASTLLASCWLLLDILPLPLSPLPPPSICRLATPRSLVLLALPGPVPVRVGVRFQTDCH